MSYHRLDEQIQFDSENAKMRLLLEQIWRLLGISYRDRYNGVKYYYYKGLFVEDKSKSVAVIAFTDSRNIIIARPGNHDDKLFVVEVIYAKEISKLALLAPAGDASGKAELNISYGAENKSGLVLSSGDDTNEGWRSKYAEQIRAIAAFLAQF